MSSVRRFLLALLLAAATVIVVLSPAQALDCVGMPDRLTPGRTAFTGHIVAVDEQGTREDADDPGLRFRVDVDEIWSGPAVRDLLWLETSLDIWWGVDDPGLRDGFVSDDAWLFRPSVDDDGRLTVNPCNSWPLSRGGSEALRPTAVREPVQEPRRAAVRTPAPEADDSTRTWVIAGSGVGVLGLLVAVGLRARRRTG